MCRRVNALRGRPGGRSLVPGSTNGASSRSPNWLDTGVGSGRLQRPPVGRDPIPVSPPPFRMQPGSRRDDALEDGTGWMASIHVHKFTASPTTSHSSSTTPGAFAPGSIPKYPAHPTPTAGTSVGSCLADAVDAQRDSNGGWRGVETKKCICVRYRWNDRVTAADLQFTLECRNSSAEGTILSPRVER
ncbi:hypothetical protein DPEC_G00173460 [Dallia pectoralis]|uniref:Uncharacterized protein n=1 Tax=Dallia pectoralis TaxID=75939 RepID=A0ACC2GE49_DALPE|nr:hypothetical protein DPEC_G00173460 [Dallia pectoralis]